MQYTHATYLRIFVHGHVALFKKKKRFCEFSIAIRS